MIWVAFLFTNLIFATGFLIVSRRRLTELLDGARQELSLKSDELNLKSSLESSLSSNLGKLIELDALAEKIIEYRSYNARLRAIRGRQLISRTELEALETRLRELNETKEPDKQPGDLNEGEGRSLKLTDELTTTLDTVGFQLLKILKQKEELKDLFIRTGQESIIVKVISQVEDLQARFAELKIGELSPK